ncbi:hypothetical protein PWEIH_02679 [Listeria weihenstephanensis FSL R9-0317]|uniref:Uncharacterized protein n=1 Tax=Listeria weihenstephanensis TaxID=1006155 RepID=A0A1S7FS98_9LIST|nr:hypothetical protein [Listeria weihenstephanensis]AQY50294.1 hypothetical protein UE46_04130 [Listeria weihenstephanensis]EUJ40916.1 hypothetical protein PWEIH_02679 [Listeria weihenstephanensis FSL R9-0317]MBC1501183.1 hypothetical protein [Listeria weihenstephanensis]
MRQKNDFRGCFFVHRFLGASYSYNNTIKNNKLSVLSKTSWRRNFLISFAKNMTNVDYGAILSMKNNHALGACLI